MAKTFRADMRANTWQLGRTTIGDKLLIGDDAVVVRDVPDNFIAVGMSGVVIPRGAA